MIIKRLHLENFQSIRGPVTLDLAPLTLLYGPNSAGKSAIGDALQFIGSALTSSVDPALIEKWWHNVSPAGRFVVGLGVEFSAQDDIPHLLRRLGLSRFVTSGWSPSTEENDPALWMAESLLDLSHRAQPRIPEPEIKDQSYRTVQMDIVFQLDPEARLLAERPGFSRVALHLDGAPVLEILEWGATVRVHRNHPRFGFDRHPMVALAMIETEAEALIGSLPEKMRDRLVRISESTLDLRYLFAPFDGKGLRDDFAPDDNGASLFDVSWEDGKSDGSDVEDPRGVSSPWGLDEAQRSCVRALKGVFGGIFVIPARLLGSAAERLVRVGPIRVVPGARDLTWTFEKDNNFVDPQYSLDYALPPREDWTNGIAAWKAAALSPRLLGRVNRWMGEGFLGLGYQVVSRRVVAKLEPIVVGLRPDIMAALRRGVTPPAGFPGSERPVVIAYLFDEKRGTSVDCSDVGSGVTQIFPVLAAIAAGRSPLFLEQPELHLHPRLQNVVADLLLQSLDDSEYDDVVRGPVIVETHSESLALRVLRRIREGARRSGTFSERLEAAQKVGFYYFRAGESATTVHHVRVDAAGRFVDRWPEGFFEDRLEDLFE